MFRCVNIRHSFLNHVDDKSWRPHVVHDLSGLQSTTVSARPLGYVVLADVIAPIIPVPYFFKTSHSHVDQCELKWSGGWSTGTVDWLSTSERGQYLDGCPAMNTKCLVPLPFLPDLILYWEPFSWFTSVGTTRNTVIRLGWSRMGLAVLILHAAGVGLTDMPAVISGRYNRYHSLQLQNYYAHFPPLQHTHTFMQVRLCGTGHGNDHGFRCIVCWPWQEESCVIG